MAVVENLICSNENGTLSFGNYSLQAKAKKEDFEHKGDLYKVKTFATMTKLEKNGLFLYESEPGTAVNEFSQSADEVSFKVEGKSEDAQLTVGLTDNTEYEVLVDGKSHGRMKTNLSGKLTINVSLNNGEGTLVEIKK